MLKNLSQLTVESAFKSETSSHAVKSHQSAGQCSLLLKWVNDLIIFIAFYPIFKELLSGIPITT